MLVSVFPAVTCDVTPAPVFARLASGRRVRLLERTCVTETQRVRREGVLVWAEVEVVGWYVATQRGRGRVWVPASEIVALENTEGC